MQRASCSAQDTNDTETLQDSLLSQITDISQSPTITKAPHHHYYNLPLQGMVTPRSLEELAKSVELAEGSTVEQAIQVLFYIFHSSHNTQLHTELILIL